MQQDSRPKKRVWSIIDTAIQLDTCPSMVHKLIRAGKIRSVKIGSRRVVPDPEIQRISEEGTD